MTFHYIVYGLRIAADASIPGLIKSPASAEPDLKIWLKSEPPWLAECLAMRETLWYVSPEQEEGGKPALTVTKLAAGAYFRFVYADGSTFILDGSTTRLWATWPDSSSLQDTAVFLLGPVLGFVLRSRGTVCLHASAVAIGREAIVLVGIGGAGKSTTAAAFARQGYAVLSDDVAPMQPHADAYFVRPGYPRLCLWPESVSLLYGGREALPRLTPNWEKCYLSLDDNGHRFQHEPLPLGAIYLLGERAAGTEVPRVQPVPASGGLVALVQNTYMNYLLDKQRRAQEFEFLGRLLSRVPVRRVTPHQDPTRLTKLCEVIVSDFKALPQVALAAMEGCPR